MTYFGSYSFQILVPEAKRFIIRQKISLAILWKDRCWSWNSNTLAAWCEELTHLKRPWCWERLRAGGEGDNRGWDGWMASPTQWTWVWVNTGSWWWTGRPGVLRFLGSQRVRHDWRIELELEEEWPGCRNPCGGSTGGTGRDYPEKETFLKGPERWKGTGQASLEKIFIPGKRQAE